MLVMVTVMALLSGASWLLVQSQLESRLLPMVERFGFGNR
jgi:hypothetical protein